MKILTYAAIDMGSNAIRLLINHIYIENKSVTFNKTALIRIPIRLGHDAFTYGKITEENIQRLIKGMKSYKLLMEVYQVQKYRCFATSAMRDSTNSKEVIEQVKVQSGIEIEIIGGDMEAEIIFQTELSKFSQSNFYHLFVDVGGGSTELSLLHKGKIIASQSFQIGTVRMLDNKVEKDFLKKNIKPWVDKYVKGHKVNLIGSGGNINYVFKQSRKKEGTPISFEYMEKFYETIKNLTYEEKLTHYNMKPDRADVIVPATEIYVEVMKWANAQKIYIPKIGVSDGMIQWMYHKENNNTI